MFSFEEFKNVAIDLAKSNSGKNRCGKMRTAIGRMYYFIFLKVREKLINLYPRTIYYFQSTKVNSHRFLIDIFENSTNYMEIGDKLYNLRDYRNKADYDLQVVFTKDTINTCKVILLYLEDAINQLSLDNDLRQAIEVTMRKYNILE